MDAVGVEGFFWFSIARLTTKLIIIVAMRITAFVSRG